MTAQEAAIAWCARTHDGDWRAAWKALKAREGAPVAIRPSLPRDARHHWLMLAMWHEGILLGDCGLHVEIIPFTAVGLGQPGKA